MASSPKVKVAEAFVAEGGRPLTIDEICEITYLSRHHVTTVLKSGDYDNGGKLRNARWIPNSKSADPIGRKGPPRPTPQAKAVKLPPPRYLRMTKLSEAMERKLISLPHERLDEKLREKTVVVKTDTVYTAVQLLARAYKEGDLAIFAYEKV